MSSERPLAVGAARGYRPIGDYALIGDTRVAALVSRDGSIDWACLPDVDSPAVFCRLLDAGRGRFFRIGPIAAASVVRTYVGDTNVLATTCTTAHGTVRMTDLMAVEPRAEHPQGVQAPPTHDILRLVEGVAGAVEVEVAFHPTFDFARADTTLTPRPGGAVARSGADLLVLGRAAARLQRRADRAAAGGGGRAGVAHADAPPGRGARAGGTQRRGGRGGAGADARLLAGVVGALRL